MWIVVIGKHEAVLRRCLRHRALDVGSHEESLVRQDVVILVERETVAGITGCRRPPRNVDFLSGAGNDHEGHGQKKRTKETKHG